MIPNQEVTTGVFMPNIYIYKSNKAFIRFLNTNDSIISIEQNRIKTENISDYNVITQRLNKIENRQSKVMDILKKNFPEQFKLHLRKSTKKIVTFLV